MTEEKIVAPEIRLALVVGSGDNDFDINVVDVERMQPLDEANNVYIIETKWFSNKSKLVGGVCVKGKESFTKAELQSMINKLK